MRQDLWKEHSDADPLRSPQHTTDRSLFFVRDVEMKSAKDADKECREATS